MEINDRLMRCATPDLASAFNMINSKLSDPTASFKVTITRKNNSGLTIEIELPQTSPNTTPIRVTAALYDLHF